MFIAHSNAAWTFKTLRVQTKGGNMKPTEADRNRHDRALSGHKMHHKHLKHINSNQGRRCSRKEADRTRLETLAWLLLVFPKVIQQQQPSEKIFSKMVQRIKWMSWVSVNIPNIQNF